MEAVTNSDQKARFPAARPQCARGWLKLVLLAFLGLAILYGVFAFGYNTGFQHGLSFKRPSIVPSEEKSSADKSRVEPEYPAEEQEEVEPTPDVQYEESGNAHLVEEYGEDLLTVNTHTPIDDETTPYLTFQVKYPSKYFVTSDDMITSYVSMGGMAPPRLAFTVGRQWLYRYSKDGSWFPGIGDEEDCILIWSTCGWDLIEDFQTHGSAGKPPRTISQKNIKIDDYKIDRRVVRYENSESNNVEAFIKLPERVAYFFQTCNTNSEKDLDVMLETFDVRAYALERE